MCKTKQVTALTSLQIISTLKTKDNWQLIRKLILTLKNVTFFSDSVLGNGLIYNSKNIYNFKNFINFFYLNTKSLSNISFYLKTEAQQLDIKIKKPKKNKLIKTQIRHLIDDFYLGGFDEYSNNSELMIECSLKLRTQTTTF